MKSKALFVIFLFIFCSTVLIASDIEQNAFEAMRCVVQSMESINKKIFTTCCLNSNCISGIPVKSHYDFDDDERLKVSYCADKFNWHNQGKVTPPKDQGDCGSCWAFASTAVLESKILIHDNQTYKSNPIDISEQQLISCNPWNMNCSGGHIYVVNFWESVRPIKKEKKCGSYGSNVTEIENIKCESLKSCQKLPYKITDYYFVAMNEDYIENVKKSVYKDGPAILNFASYNDFEAFWNVCTVKFLSSLEKVLVDCVIHNEICEEEINVAKNIVSFCHNLKKYIKGDSSDSKYVYSLYEYLKQTNHTKIINHYVTIIGWDDSVRAWLCKNSWGNTGPNEDGSFWIAYEGHYYDLTFYVANFRVIKIKKKD